MGVCGQRHASAALRPGKTLYPLYRRLDGPQGRSGRVRKILPPQGFDPRTIQPVASRYTDWAIPALEERSVWVENHITATMFTAKPARSAVGLYWGLDAETSRRICVFECSRAEVIGFTDGFCEWSMWNTCFMRRELFYLTTIVGRFWSLLRRVFGWSAECCVRQAIVVRWRSRRPWNAVVILPTCSGQPV